MNDTLILDGDLIIDVDIDGEPDSVISVGHETIVRPITITENGHYEPEAGVDGFSSVDVDVKYQNLIDYINEVTGGGDTNLSDAVATLADGYSRGGGLFTAEKIKTYTVEESWENDAKGNPVAIFTALGLDRNDLTNYSETFLCIFKNNNTSSQYKCDSIQYSKDTSVTSCGAYVCRNNYNSIRTANGTATSAWASIGTTIDIYKVKINL